jgi:excisionase family DNA binding protein
MDEMIANSQEGQLLTIRQVAEKVGIRASTIYRWHARGLIPFHSVEGKNYLTLEEFERWLEAWLARTRRTGRITEREWRDKRDAFLRREATEGQNP